MARVSKDDTSWKASGIAKRDFQHQHNGPNEMPPPRNKKNTRKWCKGKRGRKHDVQWVSETINPNTRFEREGWTSQCVNCGKVFERHWSWGKCRCSWPGHSGPLASL